jgi:hypothetical protein
MLTRLLAPLFLATHLLATGQTLRAQTDDQQALQEQMQDVRAQILDNMQKQGVDPVQFFQDIGQRLQDGSLDFSQLQQELVDKGFVEQATVDKLTDSVQNVTFANLKQQLNATDDEWAVLQPKIKIVIAAQARIPNSGSRRMGGFSAMSGFTAKELGPNPVPQALTALRTVVRTATATNEAISEKLKALRDAHQSVKATLASAQKDLRDLLTVRQEAILSNLGILP